MSEVTSTGAVVAGTKGLWVAVGVLGAAVVGLGGTLYATQRQAAQPEPVVSVATPAEVPVPAPVAPKAVAEKAAVIPAAEPPHKPRPAPVKKAAAVEAPVVSTPPVVVAPVPVPAPVPVAVCADCATVTAVTPVEREVEASGTGAIAGGLLGGLVGNQVGKGTGRTLATAIGVIGGGLAGNQVEKKMNRVVAYQIELRMDDGSRRTMQLDAPVAVGSRVRLDGGALQALRN